MEKETDNFKITVEQPEELDSGEVKARITTEPLEGGESYDEQIKIKGRTVSEYTNNIQTLHSLEDKEQEELKIEIMKLKNEIRNLAEKEQQAEDQTDQDLNEEFDEMLHHVLTAGGQLEKEALKPDYDVEMLIQKVDPAYDLVVPYNDTLELTDEGRARVKDFLGFDSFDGDPEAEAQKQLDNNPLQYYLESFNKLHKGDHLLKIWELISAMSATCADRQIHSWAVGPSGKGKSHLKRQLLKFLPNEAYTQKESFSPKALQYKAQKQGSNFLNNQLVYFDEVGENIENAIELIRLLTDQDKDLVEHETVKDQEIITLTLETGNITVWFTSVDTIQDEQLKNRFILTNPDASSAQDTTVNQHQQNILNYGGDLDFIPKEAPVIQRIIRDIRENTPEYKPIVPFKINWKQEFNRRLYPFFYTLMGMIAKIHYRNRETKKGYIFVTEADFELAKLIWGKLIDTTVAQTDEQSIELLKQLPESENEALKRRELRNRLTGFTTRKVAETCDKLEETEELQLINTKYEDGEYAHWAGADIKKLVDNEPEIQKLSRETVEDMIEEAGIEPTQQIVDSVFNAEIEVYNYLKEKVEEQEEREEENQEELPEVTDTEEYILSQMKTFAWEATLEDLENMTEKDINVTDIATDLEEKEVIRIQDDKPSSTAKLDKLQGRGEVSL